MFVPKIKHINLDLFNLCKLKTSH